MESAAFKRLNVVVPYRDREAHLNVFVPLVRAYFARDKIDKDIPYRVVIVEQEKGLRSIVALSKTSDSCSVAMRATTHAFTMSTTFQFGPTIVGLTRQQPSYGMVPRADQFRLRIPSVGWFTISKNSMAASF